MTLIKYSAPGARDYAETKGNCDEKITAELANIETVFDAHDDQITYIGNKCVMCRQASLTPGNANAFCLAWHNTYGTLTLLKIIVDITTPGGTPGALGDFGTGATATTHSDNIIDGGDLNAAACLDNITNVGTNGKTSLKIANGEYLTGQILVENAAALAGTVSIFYY